MNRRDARDVCRHLSSCFACVVPVVAFAWCTGCTLDCEPSVGECPPPPVGLTTNAGIIAREVWADVESAGSPGRFIYYGEHYADLSYVDADAIDGTEVMVRGDQGLAILSPDGATLAALPNLRVPGFRANFSLGYGANIGNYKNVLLVDTDIDGNTEFLVWEAALTEFEESRLTLYAHDGSVLFDRQVNIRDPVPDPTRDILDLLAEGQTLTYYLPGDWAAGDVDNDGTVEFAATALEGIDIFRPDGTTIATVGEAHYSQFALANMVDDANLELVISDLESVSVLNLDGEVLSSFALAYWNGGIVRVPELEGYDGIRDGCTVYDGLGNPIAELGEFTDGAGCFDRDVDYLLPFEIEPGPPRDPFDPAELAVRFDPNEDHFRVSITYSIGVEVPFLAGLSAYFVTRTILEIYDPEAALVYREVISGGSRPGSSIAIPGSAPGSEILLLAHAPQIIAYSLKTD